MFKYFDSVRAPYARFFQNKRLLTVWTQPKRPFVGGGHLAKKPVRVAAGDRVMIRAPKEAGYDAFVTIARQTPTGRYYGYAKGWIRYGAYENLKIVLDGGDVKEVKTRRTPKEIEAAKRQKKTKAMRSERKKILRKHTGVDKRTKRGANLKKIADALGVTMPKASDMVSCLKEAGMKIIKDA